MSYSSNEIASLAQKAARGAGFPPRQADLFGLAAARFLATSDATEVLKRALADPTDSPILRLPLLVEDILRALDLTGPDVTLTLHPGDEALAPVYANLLPVRVENAQVQQSDDEPARLSVRADLKLPAQMNPPARISAPSQFVHWLSQLAEKTYVSPSIASRSSGAGAGDIDND